MTPADIFAAIAAIAACVAVWKLSQRSDVVYTVRLAERMANKGQTELAARLMVEALDGIKWDRMTDEGKRTWMRRAARLNGGK